MTTEVIHRADGALSTTPVTVDSLAFRPGDAFWSLMVRDSLHEFERSIRLFGRPLDGAARIREVGRLERLVAMADQQVSAVAR